MRVLTFFDGRRSTARRLQMEFLEQLNQHCKFMVYGPREHDLDSKLAPFVFDPKHTVQDIMRELKPDIIMYYQSLVAQQAQEHIKGFDSINIPRVILEVDLHDVKDKGWYKKSGIELLLHRGTYSKAELTAGGIPTIWLPHSVTDEFKPKGKRYNKLVFCGGGRYTFNTLYRIRQHAILTLESCDLLDYLGNVGYEPYPEKLNSYLGALTCAAGENSSILGKHFEIMGSGTAMLSQHFIGEDVLFGKEQFGFFYSNDLHDIITVAKKMINDPDKTSSIANRGLRIVNNMHRTQHRIYELYRILKAVAGGEKVPMKWGH